MAAPNTPKPTLQQSFASTVAMVQPVVQKIIPHLGFAFLICMLLGVTAVVFLVGQTMQLTSTGEDTATSQALSEYAIPSDQATISKLQALSNDNTSPNITLPGGRINPFSESVY